MKDFEKGGREMDEEEKIFEEAVKRAYYLALKNALEHQGKALPKAVAGPLLARYPQLRKDAKRLYTEVRRIVDDVNEMEAGEREKEFEKAKLQWGREEEMVSRRPKGEPLPPLNGDVSSVRMRFAPGPSGPLHLGHSRASVLNDEYVKRYRGELVLRLEDTNPEKVLPEAYEMIPEDLEWLGVRVHETVIQSDLFFNYSVYAVQLLEEGHAYVCRCPNEEFKHLREMGKACPHRDLPPDQQLEEWDRMLQGYYAPGEAVMVVKTDLSHPNPALRDFKAFRIIDTPHPRTGTRYNVYPLMNFSVAVDDHMLRMTHVLRGMDHLTNTKLQEYIYRYLGWDPPEYIHYGWVSIEDVVLKTSEVYTAIKEGRYSGWSDVRVGTLRAFAKRGIDPRAIREAWVEVGISETPIVFSMEHLYSKNRRYVEPGNRFSFVYDPVVIELEGAPSDLEGKALLHPVDKSRGFRRTPVRPDNDGVVRILVTEEDAGQRVVGEHIRLKDLCNVEILEVKDDGIRGRFSGREVEKAKEGKYPIIHWVYSGIPAVCHMPKGSDKYGVLEGHAVVKDQGKVVQLERFAFARIGKVMKMDVGYLLDEPRRTDVQHLLDEFSARKDPKRRLLELLDQTTDVDLLRWCEGPITAEVDVEGVIRRIHPDFMVNLYFTHK